MNEPAPDSSASQPSGSQPSGSQPSVPAKPPVDPVAVAAVGIGALGIVFFGIVAAIVTALLAAQAGRRAQADGRPQENAFLAMALAFVDGAVWLFLHYRFELPIWVG